MNATLHNTALIQLRIYQIAIFSEIITYYFSLFTKNTDT